MRATDFRFSECLTTAEAAKQLGCTPGRIRQLLLSGQLTGFKRGVAWFIPVSAIERYREPRKRGRRRKYAS